MTHIRADNLALTYRPPQRALFRAPRALRPAGANVAVPNPLGDVQALRGISFELTDGARLGLVGHNGAGKTTLLKLLFGIFEPSAGTIEVDGRRDALFNINLGFRRNATGRRNIYLRGLINGRTKQEIAALETQIIEFSELGDFIDAPMKTYSAGMAARLAFSIATALEPDILLMDEWIGAGDPEFQEKARARMRELADRASIMVLASHNHALLRRVCTHILELENGTMRQLSDADTFFREYARRKA
ncbi:MAG: ABC transporter ATP-binding protein [Pseudomonadota bacterium]